MATFFHNTYVTDRGHQMPDKDFSAGSFVLNSGLIRILTILFLSLTMLNRNASAQQSNLNCNDQTSFSLPAISGITVTTPTLTHATVANPDNLKDAASASSATVTLDATRSGTLCGTANNATAVILVAGTNDYPVGNYVGFVTSNDLSGFSSVTISAVSDASTVSSTTSPIVSSLGGGLYEVGFVTSGLAGATFKGIEITLKQNSFALGCGTNIEIVDIYNAFQVKYCTDVTNILTANTRRNASLPDFNLTASGSPGDLLTVLTVGGVVNKQDGISRETDDYARIVQVLTSLGTKFYQVHDNITTYPAGTFAGFEISAAAALQLNVLSEITIQTLLNGTPVDNASGAGLLLSGAALTAGTRSTIGFTSSGDFNEVRITLNGVGVLAGETRIYNAVFERFAEGPSLACNTPTQLSAPTYPLTVSLGNTGLSGTACVACSVSSQDNIIDADLDNSATINVLATVGAAGSISVKKEGVPYSAGTFAGFSVGNAQLVGLDLIGSITISTFFEGAPRESKQGNAGLANVGLLTGSRQTIGFLTTQDFDEIKITVTQLTGVTQTTAVYGPVITNFCNDGVLTCNTPVNLVNPTYAVFVNSANTVINSALCVNCSISNTQNVIDGTSTSDFATVNVGVTAGNVAGFAVKNAITNYPAGTYAAFDVSTISLLDASALSAIRIRTYLEGVETVHSGYTGTGLLVGATLLNAGRQIIGVVAEDIFDEVKIEFINTVGVDLSTIHIHNAVIQSLCNNNPIVCGTTAFLNTPAQPVVIESTHSGLTGVCALCEINNPSNVISASTSDFAVISIPVGAVGSASISVKNGVVDYPGNSVVGFTIRNLQPTVAQLQLIQSLTLRTYLNGVPTGESASGTTLLQLQLLLPLIGNGTETDIYNVNFKPVNPFDEVRISVAGVAGLLNAIEVYGAFVTPASNGGPGGGCATPILTFKPIPYDAFVDSPYNNTTPPADVADYTGVNERYSVVAGTGFDRLPQGLTMDPITGVISGTPSGPVGIYSFLVQVKDGGGTLIGQKVYQINVRGSLPVKLVSFAAAKEGSTTLLSWVTSEEVNSERFDVERSDNGKSWAIVASEAAMGESRTTKRYSITDTKPMTGLNYYRLKMIDLDGTFAYSRIESVNFGMNTEASLFPNPVGRQSDFLIINISDWTNVTGLRIVDVNGKVVIENSGDLGGKVSTRNLSAGLYFVQIFRRNGMTSTYKFAKQ